MPAAPEPPLDWPFAVPAHDMVTLAYRSMLGREPDRAGLEYWTRAVIEARDPSLVVAGIEASDEYKIRATSDDDWVPVAEQAAALLARRPTIVDIGAQAFDGHVYDRLTSRFSCDLVGFDPLENRIAERQETESGQHRLTLLPYAIGDGRQHTLHINNEDATSSLFPLNRDVTERFNHLCGLVTVTEAKVETRRLDDVIDMPRVDLLKLDVQGAELMALGGGPETLGRTAVVHCEVEFLPIYRNQPLFGEIDRTLTAAGFEFVDFPVLKHYHYVGRQELGQSPDQLVWADAVYFRISHDPEVLIAQALLAAAVYGKLSLARHLLERVSDSAQQCR